MCDLQVSCRVWVGVWISRPTQCRVTNIVWSKAQKGLRKVEILSNIKEGGRQNHFHKKAECITNKLLCTVQHNEIYWSKMIKMTIIATISLKSTCFLHRWASVYSLHMSGMILYSLNTRRYVIFQQRKKLGSELQPFQSLCFPPRGSELQSAESGSARLMLWALLPVPTQRKDSLLCSLYLAHWPYFSSLPLSVSTNLHPDSSGCCSDALCYSIIYHFLFFFSVFNSL